MALLCTLLQPREFLYLTMRQVLVWFIIFMWAESRAQPATELARWKERAGHVTIIRDKWGIPHVYGKTDADAVFGLMYAQCEDDFPRVELNFIEKLGRLAEVHGRREIPTDLMNRVLLDQDSAQGDFRKAPAWLRELLQAHADGINYFLHTHPGIHPKLLTHFEPWYHLLWTDGSIGAINTAGITTEETADLYLPGFRTGSVVRPGIFPDEVVTGSNGIAIAPVKSESGQAMLYINPHVSFYFRPEVHMVSEEGLNAYGAVTWGQMFVYQGFNEKCGWMHTSSYVDVADTYLEKITQGENEWEYEFENRKHRAVSRSYKFSYVQHKKSETVSVKVHHTRHGPVLAQRRGAYLSLCANNRSTQSLIQSWQRTKAGSYAAFSRTMDLLSNASNNTVYADADGNIAYWHGNFIPRKDPSFNWSKPVDGSIAATEWKGLHPVKESVHLLNPPGGWLQNCNSSPFSAAGKESPHAKDYALYLAPDGENFRSINAVRLLEKPGKLDSDKLIALGYDRTLTSFVLMIPALMGAFERSCMPHAQQCAKIAPALELLRAWDFKVDEHSVAATLAIEWGQRISQQIWKVKVREQFDNDRVEKTIKFLKETDDRELIGSFAEAVEDLEKRFGKWEMPWGEINRYQRLSGDLELRYSDSLPSLPVAFASATWGMLPSFGSNRQQGTQKRYGTNGNSFVCVVEFGKKIKARSLLTGGESGSPASPHFSDQAEMYRKGEFKEVLFYEEDVRKGAERVYQP
jgi:acyl-homoserine lactone acylase PvdQ